MTSEHTFTLWTTALSALPTIVFTGVIAYWTWRRDQERIIVQKSPQYWNTLDGTQPDAALCGVGVVVTNLSLFPVRITGLGFLIDGKKSFPLDREKHKVQWSPEIASHARMVVYAEEGEWKQLVNILGNRGRVNDWNFVAIANTETGRRFASNRFSVRVFRPLKILWRWLRRKTGRSASSLE
jgi:hypothetical protein